MQPYHYPYVNGYITELSIMVRSIYYIILNITIRKEEVFLFDFADKHVYIVDVSR